MGMPSNMGAGMPGMDNNMRQMMQQMGWVLFFSNRFWFVEFILVVLELVQAVDLEVSVEPKMLPQHLMLKHVSLLN